MIGVPIGDSLSNGATTAMQAIDRDRLFECCMAPDGFPLFQLDASASPLFQTLDISGSPLVFFATEPAMRNLPFLIALSLCTPCLASDPEIIQLERVWSYHMPKTRPFYKVLKGTQHHDPPQRDLLEIQSNFRSLPEGEKSGQLLLVQGHGFEALKNANIAIKEELPPLEYPAGEKLSVLFFAHPGKGYVQIKKVEHSARTVSIFYRIAPNPTLERTRHVALIPLPAFEADSLTVQIVDPPEATEKDLRRVCRSATFHRSATT